MANRGDTDGKAHGGSEETKDDTVSACARGSDHDPRADKGMYRTESTL